MGFADENAAKAAKAEVEKSKFKDAIKNVQDKAEDAKAVVKKMKKEVKEKKTVYEVTHEITTCELNDGGGKSIQIQMLRGAENGVLKGRRRKEDSNRCSKTG